jgi:hypothetical protein
MFLMPRRHGAGCGGRWFKQVTLGDCNTPQPGVWSIEARAKWNGWNKMKGLSADECRARYLKQLAAKVPRDWVCWPNLDNLKNELVRLAARCCCLIPGACCGCVHHDACWPGSDPG